MQKANEVSPLGWQLSPNSPTDSVRSSTKTKSESRSKGATKPTRKRVKPYDMTGKHQRVTSYGTSESGPPSPSSPTHLVLAQTPATPTLEQLLQLEQPPPSVTQLPALQGSSVDSESSPDALATPLDYQSDVPMMPPLGEDSLHAAMSTIPSHPHAIPFLFGDLNPTSLPVPTIHRLIPNSGPTHGGIEVTVLGANFHPAIPLHCIFGDVPSTSVQRWSDNTLVCILPPRTTAGAVPVYFQGVPPLQDSSDPAALFTYTSESDRALWVFPKLHLISMIDFA